MYFKDCRLHGWVEAEDIGTDKNVVAVRVQLSAGPDPSNADVKAQVSPRGLDTVVALRNQVYKK